MALSEQEQKALREIEQSLMAADPDFRSAISGDRAFGLSADASSRRNGTRSLRALAIGAVGLLLLVGGIALSQSNLWFIALSVSGFLVMFGAGVWALKSQRTSDSLPADVYVNKKVQESSRKGGSRRGGSGGIEGFTGKMEENFRRRFDTP